MSVQWLHDDPADVTARRRPRQIETRRRDGSPVVVGVSRDRHITQVAFDESKYDRTHTYLFLFVFALVTATTVIGWL